MNAAQAVALPKDRARRRPGSPRPPLYLVPSPEADHPVTVPPVMPRPAATRTVVPSSPPAGSLRLTRRGRVVAAAMAALLVTALSLIAAVSAQATSHSAPRQHLMQVVVRPGQSLWTVAESADPNLDTRLVVKRIVDLNGLSSAVVQPGQRLWVPRS